MLLLYSLSRHINGNSYLVNMRRTLRIPQVSTPYGTNGTDGHGVCEMWHKERKMGTMVEKIQPVSPANFLCNMVKIFANTGNALPPSRLRTPFGARHESTVLCGWVSSTGKGPVHIPNWKGAVPYPQLERGQSISPTTKGRVHIQGRSTSPTGKGPCKKRGLGPHIKSGPKKMPACARCADAPPFEIDRFQTAPDANGHTSGTNGADVSWAALGTHIRWMRECGALGPSGARQRVRECMAQSHCNPLDPVRRP